MVEPVDLGNNATYARFGYTIGPPFYRTEVGAHENSSSPYGTFDQGGNVLEWTETTILETMRVVRGGWYQSDSFIHAGEVPWLSPVTERDFTGFRVGRLLLNPADLDSDKDVDLSDYALFQSLFGRQEADINGDGEVDYQDIAVFCGGFTGPKP